MGRTRRVGLVRLETDKTHSHFRLRKFRSSYQGTKNVAIYAFSSGKILDVRQIAGVKDMTNIMSDDDHNDHHNCYHQHHRHVVLILLNMVSIGF